MQIGSSYHTVASFCALKSHRWRNVGSGCGQGRRVDETNHIQWNIREEYLDWKRKSWNLSISNIHGIQRKYSVYGRNRKVDEAIFDHLRFHRRLAPVDFFPLKVLALAGGGVGTPPLTL